MLTLNITSLIVKDKRSLPLKKVRKGGGGERVRICPPNATVLGWELAHRFSEQIARFFAKKLANEQISE